MPIDSTQAKELYDAVMTAYKDAKSSEKDGLLRRDLSTDEVRKIVLNLQAVADTGAISALDEEQAEELTSTVDEMLGELSGTAWGAFGAAELGIGKDKLASVKLRFDRALSDDAEPSGTPATYEALSAAFKKAIETKEDGVMKRFVSSDELRELMLLLEPLATKEAFADLSDEHVEDLNKIVSVLTEVLSGPSGGSFGMVELVGLNHLALVKLALEDAASDADPPSPRQRYEAFTEAYDKAFESKRDGVLWRDVTTSELQGIVHLMRPISHPGVIKELSSTQVEDLMGRTDKLIKELSGTAAGSKGAAELTIGKDALQTLKMQFVRALAS